MAVTLDGVKFIHKKKKGTLGLVLLSILEFFFTIVLVISLAANVWVIKRSEAVEGVSRLLSYQGRLTDASGNVLGGSGTNYCFRFSVYDATSGGSKLWPSGTPVATVASVSNGVFNTAVGLVPTYGEEGGGDTLASFSFYSNETTYLNVEVGGTWSSASACTGASWESLNPRQRVDAVGYARVAEDVYSDLLYTDTTSGYVRIGSGTGKASGQKLLVLDVKNVSDTIGGACTVNGSIWYNSSNTRALVCDNSTIQEIGNLATIVGIKEQSAGSAISSGIVNFSAVTNLTIVQDGQDLNFYGPDAGGGGTVEQFSPMLLREATATTTASLSQLYLIPFQVQANLSFEQINMIGSATVVPTSAANTLTFRLGSASASPQSQGFSAGYTISNRNDIDLFLFSRGSGSYSSEIQTFASTRNSFITHYMITYSHSARWTAGNSATRGGASHTVSVNISFPALTSGQVIDGVSSYTTWDQGYSSWGSTASTSSATATYSTSATASVSVASTYPATTAWASNKLIPLMFATSLTPGEYWLGMVRYSGTSSSSLSGITTSIAHTATGATVDYRASAMTQTAQITWVGDTNVIASSLAWMGQNTAATIAPAMGLGSFSNTWVSSNTYLNNADNPAGAVGFSQISTNVSFFRTWIQFAKRRI